MELGLVVILELPYLTSSFSLVIILFTRGLCHMNVNILYVVLKQNATFYYVRKSDPVCCICSANLKRVLPPVDQSF